MFTWDLLPESLTWLHLPEVFYLRELPGVFLDYQVSISGNFLALPGKLPQVELFLKNIYLPESLT